MTAVAMPVAQKDTTEHFDFGLLEPVRREAHGALSKAQVALQSIMNVVEQGYEPGFREYGRLARHMRFAAGALEAMKTEVKAANALVERLRRENTALRAAAEKGGSK